MIVVVTAVTLLSVVVLVLLAMLLAMLITVLGVVFDSDKFGGPTMPGKMYGPQKPKEMRPITDDASMRVAITSHQFAGFGSDNFRSGSWLSRVGVR